MASGTPVRVQAFSTAFTRLFKVQAPICLAPMYGAPAIASGRLAAAVARGGGLGIIGAGPARDLEVLASEVATFRQEAPPGSPLAIGVVSWAAVRGPSPPLAAVIERFAPDVMWFFAPAVPSTSSPEDKELRRAYDTCHQRGIKIMAQVGTLADVLAAEKAGASCIICQGTEAGGHGLRQGRGTLAFAVAAVEALRDSSSPPAATDLPGQTPDPAPASLPVILAAGGIAGGRALAAVLAAGCDGVVIGTRFWASAEAGGAPQVKAALAAARGDATVRTRAYDVVSRVVKGVAWPPPYDSSRVMRNDFTAEYDGNEELLEAELGGGIASRLNKAEESYDFRYACLHCGEGVDLIAESAESGEAITRRILREAEEAIDRLEALRPPRQESAETGGGSGQSQQLPPPPLPLAIEGDKRLLISSGSAYEAVAGYSRAVRAGPLVHVAGTTAAATDGKSVLHAGDAGAQAAEALQRIAKALREAGAGMESVVRTRIFVTRLPDCEAVMAAHGAVFRDVRPAATMVVVSALVHPDMLVEIEADAHVLPPPQQS